tara:strand:+ start:295 stop:594 length:300 start_codon:yes stop_codon:yes gene_type:complete
MSRYTCKYCEGENVYIRVTKVELHPIQAHRLNEDESGRAREDVVTFFGGPRDESEIMDAVLYCADCNDDGLIQDDIIISEGVEATTDEERKHLPVSYSE